MNYTELILQAGLLIGYLLIFAIIFAESGLLIGFFLPGDSLLVSLGLLASRGHLDIYVLIVLGSVAAILGDSAGYYTGKRFGRGLFNRPDSRFFKKENILKAEAFYKEHGKKTIVLARFVPVVRTFAPIIAGTAQMPYGEFLRYNILGGIGWVGSMSLIGYFLGSVVPDVDKFILPIIGLVVIASVVPAAFHVRNSGRKDK